MKPRILVRILAPALVLAVACSKDRTAASDTSLSHDLTLAGQAKTATLDSISAAERAKAAAASAPASANHSSSTTTHHSSGGTHSAGSSGGAAPASREVEVKHTQRDAAIGAAAGAILGATTSRDKVKGGIIGAAAGGILGGVIGNNVDKEKKKAP